MGVWARIKAETVLKSAWCLIAERGRRRHRLPGKQVDIAGLESNLKLMNHSSCTSIDLFAYSVCSYTSAVRAKLEGDECAHAFVSTWLGQP
jgi:hypothetical protein